MANKKAEILTMDGQVVSPITLATNVLLDDGRTAQDLLDSRDESMFSPTITTSSSISKVGQGDNVDFSENIIDGAYKSCVLKGKTLVNHNAEGNNRNQYACMPSLEGSNLTVNGTVEGYLKSAILKGNTLVNVLSVTNIKVSSKSAKAIEFNVQPNVQKRYVLFFKLNNIPTVSDDSDNARLVKLEWYHASTSGGFYALQNKNAVLNETMTVDILPYTGDIQRTNFSVWCPHYESGELDIDVMIIEYQEGMENWDVPYFTGMQSVKMPVLTTTGKNLFDFKNAQWLKGGNFNPTYGNSGNIVIENMSLKLSNPSSCVGTIVDGLKPNTEYYISANITNTSTMVINSGLSYGVNNTTIDGGINRKRTTNSNGELAISIGVYNANTNGGYVLVENIQVEEGSTATSYEPYKSNILTVNEEVELRGIGEVQDTLDLMTGEKVERIGEVVLDGSETIIEWQNTNVIDGIKAFSFRNCANNNTTNVNSLSDTYITYQSSGKLNMANGEGVSITSNHCYLKILTSKLETSDIDGLKKYLSQNPITVQYELETPVVKTVDLSDNVVYSYKDTTHYTCSSEEGSLLPTLAIEEGVRYEVIIKPSTKYSIVFNRTEVASGLTVDLGGATTSVTSSTLGKNIVQITTPSTLSHNYVTFKGLGNAIKDVQVIEGDVVGDVEYFEGMVDVKNPIVINCGKNLYNKNTSFSGWVNSNGDIIKNGAVGVGDNILSDYIKISPTKRYKMSMAHYQWYYDTNKKYIVQPETVSADITPPSNASYVIVGKSISRLNEQLFSTLDSIQLEEGVTPTTYEPYKSNTVTTNEVVLRSLPNGVCDTLDLTTGKYVQRIGEIVFDGSEDWTLQTQNGWQRYMLTVEDMVSIYDYTNSNRTYCDKLVYDVLDVKNSGSYLRVNNQIAIYNNEILNNINQFKQWLSQNPITVQYELATPITTTIDLKQHPFAYKDGYVVLTSSSEEISLTPTIEYSLIANRLGQIQSNQKLVEKQQAQIDELESMVVANLVNTQYQQALNEIKLGVK